MPAERGYPLSDEHRAFLHRAVAGFSPGDWTAVSAGSAASARTFVRIARRDDPSRSYILVLWSSEDPEWSRFMLIGDECSRHLDILPRRYAVDETCGYILEEDLGKWTLRRFCELSDAAPRRVFTAYRRVLASLIRWHAMPLARLPSVSSVVMDLPAFLWESDYFAEHCVNGFCGCSRPASDAWERQRRRIAELAAAGEQVCMHRDFQSENVILQEETVRFVDFQGSRRGPALYDLASLLYDPYAEWIDDPTRDALVREYRLLGGRISSLPHLHACAIQRLMQASGAYGNLARNRGMKRYARYLPPALDRLAALLDASGEWPAVNDIVRACRRGLHESA